jgi:uncharacterized RDD family membrane protein YckC
VAVELQDRLTVEGAEGLDLDVTLAGLGSRTGAAVIDLLLQMVMIFAITLIAAMFGDAGVALAVTGVFVVVFGYPIAAETLSNGQTVGKRALGIAVVKADGTPVTFMASTVRNVLRVVDLLPGTYLVGRSVLPGLGQEGELIAAWSVARVITGKDRQRQRMRRQMWSKIETS